MKIERFFLGVAFAAAVSMASPLLFAQVTQFAVTQSGGVTSLASSPKVAGTAFSVRVRALDADGNVVTNYARSVTVSLAEPFAPNSAWARVVVPAGSFVNGVADPVTLVPIHAGTNDRRVMVTDGNVATYDASGPFSISPARFAVTLTGTNSPLPDRSHLQGRASAVRVSAVNQDGSIAQTYTGDVTLSSGALGADVSATILERGFVDGVQFSMVNVGTFSVSVTNGLTTTAAASSSFAVLTSSLGNATASLRTKAEAISLVGAAVPGESSVVRFDATASDTDPDVDVSGPIDFLAVLEDFRGTQIVSTTFRRSVGIADGKTVSEQFNLAVPDSLAPGAYSVRIYPGLTGNPGAGSLTVGGLPDLSITRFDYAPGDYRGGDGLRFDLVWRNSGSVKVAGDVDYRVEIHLSADPAFDDVSGTESKDDFLVWSESFVGDGLGRDLLDGQSVVVSREFVLPDNFSGTYYLLAKVNSGGGREGKFSTGFAEAIGPAPGTILYDGNNVTLATEDGKITLLPKTAPEVRRASISSSSAQSTGLSDRPSISRDGRYVVFHSYGALAGTVAPNTANIFLRDTLTNTTELLSSAAFGGAANGASLYPRISDDGRFVLFQSDASNLVPDDTNGYTDIFVRDLQTGVTRLLSRNGSTPADQGCHLPDISDNGRFVVFESSATNLVSPTPAGGVRQVYLLNRDVAGSGAFDIPGNTAMTLVSSAGGVAGTLESSTPRISRDGSHVVFVTRAPLLVGSNSQFPQVVRWTRATGAFAVASSPGGTVLADGENAGPAINGDGSYIVFASRAKNLTADPSLVGVPHVFRARLGATGVIAMLRLNGVGGAELNNPDAGPFAPDLGSFEAAVSSDGALVAFVTESDNLLGPIAVRHIDRTTYLAPRVQNFHDDSRASDVYLVDLTNPLSPVNRRASVNQFGLETTRWSTDTNLEISQVPSHRFPAISSDGRFIAFASDAKGHSGLIFGATNFDYAATNGVKDIYVFDRKQGLATPTDRPAVGLRLPAALDLAAGSSITLLAEASSTLRGIAGVDFYANNALIGTASEPTPANTGRFAITWTVASPGNGAVTPRVFEIVAIAVDTAGVRSPLSNACQITSRPFTGSLPPTIAIVQPENLQTFTSVSTTRLLAQAADPDGDLVGVQFYVNGVAHGAEVLRSASLSPATFPFSVGWSPGAPGVYMITALARDSSNNRVMSAPVTVTSTTGSSAPLVTWLSTIDPSYPRGGVVPLAVDATSTSRIITGVQFFANGVLLSADTTAPYSGSFLTPAAGRFEVVAVASDDAGNRTTSAPLVFDVTQSDAPVVSISAPESNFAGEVFTPINVTVVVSPPPGRTITQLIFNAGSLAFATEILTNPITEQTSVTKIWTPVAIAPGLSLVVDAVDSAGDVYSSQPVTVSIADRPLPSVVLTKPADDSQTGRVGIAVMLEATATTARQGAQIDSVQFIADGMPIAVGARVGDTSTWQASWVPSSPGTIVIQAKATESFVSGGRTAISASRSISIAENQSPVVTLTAPSSELLVPVGIPFTLSAVASDPDGTVTRVEFQLGGRTIASVSNAPYTANFMPTFGESGALVAIAVDDGNRRASSGSVMVQIKDASPVTDNDAFIVESLPMLLGRQPSLAEWQAYSARFANGSLTRSSFLAELLASSDGLALQLAVRSYWVVLGQAPSPEELTDAASLLRTLGAEAGLAPLVQQLFASDAYSTKYGSITSTTINKNDVFRRLYANRYSGAEPNLATQVFAANQIGPSGVSDLSGLTGFTVSFIRETLIIHDPRYRDLYRLPAVSLDSTVSSVVLFVALLQTTPSASEVAALANLSFEERVTRILSDPRYSAQFPAIEEGAMQGSLGGAQGNASLYVRADRTAAFLGFDSVANLGYYNAAVRLTAAGSITTAHADAVRLEGVVSPDSATGEIEGTSLSFSAVRSAPTGDSMKAHAGVYSGVVLRTGSGATQAIVDSGGQLRLLLRTGDYQDFAKVAVETNGQFAALTERGDRIQGTIDFGRSVIRGTINSTSGSSREFHLLKEGVNAQEHLGNISTRGLVGLGDGVMISGFVITGNEPKSVLLTGRGPSLEQFGVPGALGNPQIYLFDSRQKVIASNDDWGTASNTAAILASGFAPGSTRESAILIQLNPGSYTVHLGGVDGAVGIGLAEVYDLSGGTGTEKSRVVNLSTRGVAAGGNEVMIGGFVVVGDAPKRVLIRGIGPLLGDFGVSGFLEDPRLALFDSSGAVISANDNWILSADSAAIVATSFEPSYPSEASILIWLSPGIYTTHLSGPEGETGVGLVEIYEVD